MKFFFALALLVAAAVAAPPSTGDKDAVIINQASDNIGLDGYKSEYQTSNGISAQEQAQLKNIGSENEALEVRGQFSYTGPDNLVYTVTYIANELGFQPSAPHLPVAPVA